MNCLARWTDAARPSVSRSRPTKTHGLPSSSYSASSKNLSMGVSQTPWLGVASSTIILPFCWQAMPTWTTCEPSMPSVTLAMASLSPSPEGSSTQKSRSPWKISRLKLTDAGCEGTSHETADARRLASDARKTNRFIYFIYKVVFGEIFRQVGKPSSLFFYCGGKDREKLDALQEKQVKKNCNTHFFDIKHCNLAYLNLL